MTALGASVKTGGTEFRVWAPYCRSVDVLVNGRAVPLRAGAGCLFEGKPRTRVSTAHDVLVLTRESAAGERVALVANLSAAARPLPPLAPGARALLDSDEPRFGGAGGAPLRPYQALLFEVGAPQ